MPRARKLKIGIPFDEPGIGTKNGTSYSGFDVETALYVAKALGVSDANITWVEATGADREQKLQSGEVDLVVSTYSITDERKKIVDFAGPYFVAHQDLLVRRNEEEIAGPDTLDGRTLCTVGHDLGRQRHKRTAAGSRYRRIRATPTASRRWPPSDVDAVTTDDVILAGVRRRAAVQGQAAGESGRGFRGGLRHRRQEGRQPSGWSR